MDFWQKLFNAFIKDNEKNANAFEIAKHFFKVYHYDLKGIEALYPDFRDKIKVLIKTMNDLGLPVILSEGIRTGKRQDELYAQGRTTPGSIVTNAKAFESYHQYGVAADIIFKISGWNAPESSWKVLGSEGKKIGLVWGGDWEFRDVAHFEWHPTFSYKDIKNILYPNA